MATFTVNGQSVTVEKNQKLIRFLRDTLQLTSVKDGCSEGACGTCHVLIDGKPTKACIPQTDKLEGKTILTVEAFPIGKSRCIPSPSARRAPSNAASASPAWSSPPRGCWT